ncbi:MAG: hypothetical protein WA726_00155 [Acidimicrobiia bacterium]
MSFQSHVLRSHLRLAVGFVFVAVLAFGCSSSPVERATTTDGSLLDCGKEDLTSQAGPFNTEARQCFARAIEDEAPARLILLGFDEEGGRVERTLRTWPDRAEETIASGDLETSTKNCAAFRIVDGPAGNPGFNGIACDGGG